MANKVRVPQRDLVECNGKCTQGTAVRAEPEADSPIAHARQFRACWGFNSAQNSNFSSLITEKREEGRARQRGGRRKGRGGEAQHCQVMWFTLAPRL